MITDDVHEVLPEGLQSLGFSIDYVPEISLAEVHDRIGDYEGLVINSKILVDESLLLKAKQLRWVGRLGSGLEIIDRAFAKTRGVEIISSPEGNAWAVGEHALAMLLTLSTRMRAADAQVRTMNWDREAVRGWEIASRSIGIVGYGHTGPAFAKTLQGFGCKILAYDKYKPDFCRETPWVQPVSTEEELLEQVDILSLHLPLTSETRGWLNAEKMDRLPSSGIVINTSRGAALDLEALIERLEIGKLAGAGLDVFPNENPSTYSEVEHSVYGRLAALPQVVLSPHVAGWTVESKRALAGIILDKVRALYLGKIPS